MHATLPRLVMSDFPPLARADFTTLQVNLGYRCNQSCLHCHVNAGPNRREVMSDAVVEDVFAFVARARPACVDLTGGAPELHPRFREIVRRLHAAGVRVIDRCNLTILEEPGQDTLAGFLAEHEVDICASLPCYLEDNVDRQRGNHVFEASIRGLQRLNALGYGKTLPLDLVYNPQGASLPPPQAALEADYRRVLGERYGIVFSRLLTLANMPIQRFGSTLISRGEFAPYMALLKSAHQPSNLDAVMCKSLVSVDWQGRVYDCDFNQMLGIPLSGGVPKRLADLDPATLAGRAIATADHCYGCTAGQGSSCGGALAAATPSTPAFSTRDTGAPL